jgi:nicotinamide-nucleotide amidase
MKAHIITIGDEILIGQTVDTNSAWIGKQLSSLGFNVDGITSVHDLREDILDALKNAEVKSDVIIITGGLGPTSDDITKQTLCDYFNTHLVVNQEVLAMIEVIMSRRSISMNENNRRQAEVPETCMVLKNIRGTAPGMWFEKEGKLFIAMPGIPYEMQYIMTEHVIPELKKRFPLQTIIYRNIMTYGLAEASLAEKLTGFEKDLPGEISLAYLPNHGIIKLRLTTIGTDRKLLEKKTDEQVNKMYEIIPELIYGENEESLEMVIGKLLKERKQTVCTAESCTGGKIAHLLTSIPGSSDYYRGSLIAYDNRIKNELLRVPQALLEKFGAVSEQVIKSMAEGARELLETDFCIASSGIAGPDGGTPDKPVGTLWIAAASEKGTVAEKYLFGYDRLTNIRRFSNAALNLLRQQVITGQTENRKDI